MCLLFALASEPPLALWLRWTGGGGPRCCCAILLVAALCVSEQRVPSGDDRRKARVCCVVHLLPSVGWERERCLGGGLEVVWELEGDVATVLLEVGAVRALAFGL